MNSYFSVHICEPHGRHGEPLPELRPLPLGLSEARVEVAELTLQLLLPVLHVLLGTGEGSQVGGEVGGLLLQTGSIMTPADTLMKKRPC